MYYDQDTRLAFKKAKKVRYWYIYFNCKKWINKILKYSLQNALIGVHFVCTLILTVGMKRQLAMILLISHRLILIEFFSANVVVLNCNSLLITSRIPCCRVWNHGYCVWSSPFRSGQREIRTMAADDTHHAHA